MNPATDRTDGRDAPAARGARGPVEVPEAFIDSYGANGDQARTWLAGLPGLAADLLDRWGLRLDGPAAHGMASLVLPVRRADGSPAVLKLQQIREETAGAAAGLRAWGGHGAVRLLADDGPSGAQLLERLDAGRTLSALVPAGSAGPAAVVAGDDEAMGVLAGLAARLSAVPAPAGVRRLGHIAAAMVDAAPRAGAALRDPAERRLVATCAAAVADLLDEPGDRLLHWDLHYDNVLAGRREPWLAIDPEPLAGDPGFELLPALDSRWDAVTATGDARGAVLRRFDLLTEALGLDRARATGWTLGRVLQNALWEVEDGRPALDPAQVLIARTLLGRGH